MHPSFVRQKLSRGETVICAMRYYDDYVREDIAAVVGAAQGTAIVKVILETAYLDREQKVRACRTSEEAGAHFVKTSTWFAPSGSTPSCRVRRAGPDRPATREEPPWRPWPT